MRSMASGDALDIIFDRDVGANCGNLNFIALESLRPSG